LTIYGVLNDLSIERVAGEYKNLYVDLCEPRG